MHFTYNRLLICTGLLGLLLIFSGCSVTDNSLSWLDLPGNQDQPEQLAEQDPDLQPVEVEPEICLDQELEALARTGRWDEPQDQSIQEVPPVDVVEPEPPHYDFPVTVNRQVEMYLELFQGKQRKYFRRWLARSGRYLPMIQEEMKSAGLPLDLAYLAMIESGFNQRAYSRSKATGLWQFMTGTARDYGLSITRYVDERRDAVKSTRAAADYLGDLYHEFGDWYLAVAAYNGGPGTMKRAVTRSKTKDFWKIAQKKHLRLETKRYVPKLIAAIIIAKEPEKYGFTDISYEAPLAYEVFPTGPGLSLEAVAMLTQSDERDIKRLNQELRTGKTPLDTEQYDLKIPAGTKELVEKNLPRLHSVVTTDYKTHIVKKNETLAAICRHYKINTTTLLKVNNLKSSQLVAGSRLRIPFRTVQYRILPEGMDSRLAAQNELILHTIKRGETVSKIAKQYQVPAELIVAWNGLPSIHKITAGQQLALYLDSNEPDLSDLPNSSSASVGKSDSFIVLSSSKKNEPSVGHPDRLYRWYLVKSGDSLWTISRRFNTSPADIKKLNNLKSNLIHPGNRLKVRDV